MPRKSARQIADEAIKSNLSLSKELPQNNSYELLETTTYTTPQIEIPQMELTQRPDKVQTPTISFDKLPQTLSVNLPDFQSLMSVSDVSDPGSYDVAGYKRVTEQQRALDKVHFSELKNWADNTSDGVAVLISMAGAAIKGAQLGQQMIRYATARETIETEKVNFKIQQSKTNQAFYKFDREVMKEQHESTMNIIEGQSLYLKVQEAQLNLTEAKAKFQVRQAEVMALVGG
jgi:hypothetical protein